MYPDFVETLAKYMRGLTDIQESIDEKEGLTPYLGKIEVMLDDEVVGIITDQGDGGFMYEPVKS